MDSFLTACGATGPIVLEVEGPGHQCAERRVLHQPFVLIGRDERSDLLLDHDLVSRRHGYLQVIEGRIFLVDLDSRSGTIFAGDPVESAWLTAGEAFEVGPYTIRLVPLDDDSGFEFHARPHPNSPGENGLPLNPLLARSAEAVELPRVSLEFQSRTAGHSVWRMSQVLALVGSSPRCKVRLLDSNVSKLHCALLRTTEGLWVIDLLGRGGITVNGAAVRFARLGSEDVLGLGQVVVRPNFEGSLAARSGNAVGGPGLWGNTSGLPALAPAAPPPDRAQRPWGFTPGGAGGQVPSHYTPGRPPAPTEPAAGDPSLSMLLGHFGQMQQQMIDQFQTSMMMMLQMFNGMHREQMGLVREELDRLRDLNNEVQQIKAQITSNPLQAAVPNTGQPQPGSPPFAPGANVWPGYGRPPAGRPATPPGPPPRIEPPRNANGLPPNGPRNAYSNGAAPPEVPPFTKPLAQRPQNWSRPAPAANPGPPSAESGSAPPFSEQDAEVHDWLNDRLSAITQEQQGRWQKIMGLLRGNKP